MNPTSKCLAASTPKKVWQSPTLQEIGNISYFVQVSPAKSGAGIDGMSGGGGEFRMTMM
jgi:hypothetical protein